jgi:uncharacterized protein (TIGR00255 family)
MVNSMTAFARAQSDQDGLSLTWEIRSVNHRFLETQFRLPEQARALEHGLRETLRKHLNRGKVDCTLRLERQAGENTIELNRPLLLQILALVEQLRRDLPEIGSPNAMDLLRWPGIIGNNTSPQDESLVRRVEELFAEALSELTAHRQREGTQLVNLISNRLEEIDKTVKLIKTQTHSISHQLQAKLRTRVEELQAKVEESRFEQEIALLAQRADVAEELDRLSIHVEEARTSLRGPGPHGRRLDFLSQELNREANTIAAKSILAETSKEAVDLKVLIEQIREQVQNIE